MVKNGSTDYGIIAAGLLLLIPGKIKAPDPQRCDRVCNFLAADLVGLAEVRHGGVEIHPDAAVRQQLGERAAIGQALEIGIRRWKIPGDPLGLGARTAKHRPMLVGKAM